ncbi:hypothetical protein CIB84_014074 [Bambusicola thoracicus]|uniref:Uncharacterized protein n=1 Tax=Bambusicola thoracicus TaxID=9083 RepID=A0A2P4SDJ6_BAMTH|nr:hypothetical protein CIB84_014074 [Bambusicola thoracicus]
MKELHSRNSPLLSLWKLFSSTQKKKTKYSLTQRKAR